MKKAFEWLNDIYSMYTRIQILYIVFITEMVRKSVPTELGILLFSLVKTIRIGIDECNCLLTLEVIIENDLVC